MIYTPKHFGIEREDLVHEIIRTYSFATLITVNTATPSISHLPLLLDESGTKLLGHMARANPQWRSFAADTIATAVFMGPHAYISPRWYEPQADNVPTWNYAVVHTHGIPEVLKDEIAAYDVMQKLVSTYDPEWPLELPDKDKRSMMREIVVFEITIKKIEAKFKLSQNRSQQDIQNVANVLTGQSDQTQREAGELMKRILG